MSNDTRSRPMTAETIHTCSYSCERPGCIRAQRDELRERLEAAPAQQPPSAPVGVEDIAMELERYADCPGSVLALAGKLRAIAAKQQGGHADGCHCATCTCSPWMTPAIRFDTSPAAQEGAIRDHLIALGWTPPGAQQPAPPSAPVGVEEMQRRLDREESDHGRTIDQRDAAEDALGRMFQAVTGRVAEWSSAWGYVDAIEEVEEHVAALSQKPAAPSGEAVATVIGHDLWSRITVDWHRNDLPPGTKLYAAPQQPAAVDEAAAILAFEEHFQASSDDPYFEGELELWLTAWRKALAAAQQPAEQRAEVEALQAEVNALRAEAETLRTMSGKPVAPIKTLARYEPDTVYIGTGEYVAECVRADDGDYYLVADVDAVIEALRAEVAEAREFRDKLAKAIGNEQLRMFIEKHGEPVPLTLRVQAAEARAERLEEALRLAEEHINALTPEWYSAGQRVLAEIRAALAKENSND